MNFYTSTSFRLAIAKLTRKPKDGYKSVVNDICEALNKKDDNFLRETNDRIRQEQNFRIVKLRVNNSAQNLPKNDGFRLIYWVSTVSDNCVLLSVYPKRGPLAANNLTNNEFKRLLAEMVDEKEKRILQKVDIVNDLSVLEENSGW
jgi:hypothetical protein